MILDDGGDATQLMLKKYPAMFKLIKGKQFFYLIFYRLLFSYILMKKYCM
jgi:hypothetical protein